MKSRLGQAIFGLSSTSIFFMLWINHYPLSVVVMSPVNIAMITCFKSTKCRWLLCIHDYGTDKSKYSAAQFHFVFLLKLVWLKIIWTNVWNKILTFTSMECLKFHTCSKLSKLFFLYSNANLWIGAWRRSLLTSPHKSFSCPWLVQGLSSFALFVFLLSLQCLCDALVMSQACPQVSTYSLCCLCKDLFQAEGFSKDLQRKSERLNTFLNMSFSLIAIGKTFESQNPVLCVIIFKIY